jgi:hypothetical protein
LWLQFDVLVECSQGVFESGVSRGTFRRIADGYFTPTVLRLWSNGEGPPETAVKAECLVAVPPGSSGDVPIFGERWTRVFEWFNDFSEIPSRAWDEVHARVLSDERTKTAVAHGVSRATAESERRLRTLARVRDLSTWRTEPVDNEIERLLALAGDLIAGIEEPTLRCIAVGAYVLADSRTQL